MRGVAEVLEMNHCMEAGRYDYKDAYTEVGGRATQDAKAEVIEGKRLEPVFQTKSRCTFQVKADTR